MCLYREYYGQNHILKGTYDGRRNAQRTNEAPMVRSLGEHGKKG